LPSTYRDLETFLHGHLPATGPDTGLVLILADRAGRAERLDRARQALTAAGIVGIRSAAILAADLDGELDANLTPAGRLLVPAAPDLPAPLAALFGTATPLQLLTERIARARGTNPDLIRRDDATYRSASDAAG
jgi:fructoselysine-6-P-deglycase FrlB-like protein